MAVKQINPHLLPPTALHHEGPEEIHVYAVVNKKVWMP